MLGNEKDYIDHARRAQARLLPGRRSACTRPARPRWWRRRWRWTACAAAHCDLALAGGVVDHLPAEQRLPVPGRLDGFAGRPHPHLRRATPQGTVFSDGVAVVRAASACPTRSPTATPIHAVIRGAAVNNDGADKASFTAPSPDGQARGDRARRTTRPGSIARSISYVEAHGTATPLGDPIEIEGLTRAFGAAHGRRGYLRASARSRATSATWSSPPARPA